MLVVGLLIYGGICFVLGIAYSEYKKHKRFTKKRHRRTNIIKKSNSAIAERSKWELDHPELLQLKACRGKTIFKGGADRMTVEEYKDAFSKTVAIRSI